MQFYNSITEYWNENIKYKRIEDEEEEQIEKYGFNINLRGDVLYHGYLFEYVSHKAILNNRSELLNTHNKNGINLIFVDYSMRIITNKAFINNIPFFKRCFKKTLRLSCLKQLKQRNCQQLRNLDNIQRNCVNI